MTDLIELAARVEGLSGPDREVDYLILEQVAGICRHEPKLVLNEEGDDLVAVCSKCGAGGSLGIPMLAYTSSVDAALTIVPDGMEVDCTFGKYWPNRARILPVYQDGDRWLHRGSDPHYCSNAATPALALTAAALRARAAQ